MQYKLKEFYFKTKIIILPRLLILHTIKCCALRIIQKLFCNYY